MSTRLPTPGGDDNDWGDILNNFLEVSHATDGTLNPNTVGNSQLQASSVGTTQIQNNAVTNTQLDTQTQTTLASVAGKYTKPGGGIPSSDLTSAVQTNLTAASTAIQQINTKTGTSVTLAASDVGAIPTSQLGASNGVATLTGTTLTGSQIPTTVVSVGATQVYAPAATGTAATDTTNLAAAITATPAGGTLWLDGAYKINAALTFPTSISVKGRQKVTYSGLSALPSGPNVLADIQGTSIEQTVASTDAIDVTIAGGTFHMEDIVVSFQSGLSGTGHGINIAPPSNEVGVYGGSLNGVMVFGHDGGHYALVLNNELEITTRDFRWSGGGGILTIAQTGSINYGNNVHIHPYGVLSASGSAYGYAHSSATGSLTAPASGGMLNLITYVRPQCNIASAAGTTGTQKMYSDSVGAGFPWYINLVGSDFEASGYANTIDYGPATSFIGDCYVISTSTLNLPGNVYSGYLAGGATGQNAGTQQKSVGIGYEALAAQTTSAANTGVGYTALTAVTNGGNNTGIGYAAGKSIVGGAGNTAVGTSAGTNVAAQSNNTSVGYSSGPSGDYSGTTTVGKSATAGANYATAIGTGTSATAAGSGAFGLDHTGVSASSSTQDQIAIGTYRHTTVFGGGGSPFSGGVVLNGSGAALATNATTGFTYIPTCAGAPTGTPTLYTGTVPLIFDTTDSRLYVYTGGAWSDTFTA